MKSNDLLDKKILSGFTSVFNVMNITEHDINIAYEDLEKPELPPDVRERLMFDGLDIADGLNSKDLDISEPMLYFMYKERFVILYQRDQLVSSKNYRLKKYGKFHICFCKALQNAKEQNRYDNRYVLTMNTDGEFKVNITIRDRDFYGTVYTEKKEQNVYRRLKVCQDCLRQVNWKNFNSYCGRGIEWWKGGDLKRRNEIVDSFNIGEFVSCSFGQDLGTRNITSTNISSPVKQYVLDSEKKRLLKKQTDCCCEVCGKQFVERELYIHHKNHNEGDNRRNNLLVVCGPCHAAIHAQEGGLVNNSIKNTNTKIEYADALIGVSRTTRNNDSGDYINRAIEQYELLLNQNVTIAGYELGKLYLNNAFVGQDKDKAYNYFASIFQKCSDGAKQGNIEEMICLANMYFNGWGVGKSIPKAHQIVEKLLAYYNKNINNIDPELCYELSKLVPEIKEAEALRKKALELFKISANTSESNFNNKIVQILEGLDIDDNFDFDELDYWIQKSERFNKKVIEDNNIDLNKLRNEFNADNYMHLERILDYITEKEAINDTIILRAILMHMKSSNKLFKSVLGLNTRFLLGKINIITNSLNIQVHNNDCYIVEDFDCLKNIKGAKNIKVRLLNGSKNMVDFSLAKKLSIKELYAPDGSVKY